MKYKILNTANADQHIPTQHGVKQTGVTGMAGKIGQKLVIPGMARGEDRSFIVVEEVDLRGIFGIYDSKRPGVLNLETSPAILMKNVKRNKPLLDNGRLVVLDLNGSHVLGKGTSEYQSKVVDATMQENQNLKDQSARFIDVLVAEGYTEEDAKKILDGKIVAGDKKLKKADAPKVNTGDGIPAITPESILEKNGVIKVGGKEYKSVDGAMKKLTAMAEEAGVELLPGEGRLPYFELGDEIVTLS